MKCTLAFMKVLAFFGSLIASYKNDCQLDFKQRKIRNHLSFALCLFGCLNILLYPYVNYSISIEEHKDI